MPWTCSRRLHEITPENADLSFLAHPEHGDSALRQQIGYQRWYYEWAREGISYPLIDRTFAWLEANYPEERPPVFNWGDARIGNMLFQDFRPVGVLDWEMATVGPREVDVAWMVFLHRFFQDLAERFEMPGIPNFMDRDEVAADYERLTGYAPAELDWFEVFAALRFAIVSVRTSTCGIAYGTMEKPEEPDDLVMFRTLLERMLDAVSEPPPVDDLRLALHRLQRLLSSRRVFSNLAVAAGVELSQQAVEVLAALALDGARPVAEIARVAHMDVAAVSRQLHSLEAEKLARRRSSPTHRSVVLVEATARGRRVAAHVASVRARQLDDVLAGWDGAERAAFGALLLRFVDDLQRTPFRPS